MDHTSHTHPDPSVPGENAIDEPVLQPETQPIPEQTDDDMPKELQTDAETIERIVEDVLHCHKKKRPLRETYCFIKQYWVVM